MSFLRQPAAFTVTGRGDFPWDMLRHDRCFPATTADAMKLERPDSPTQRAIRLVASQLADITPARWESFGWKVHDIDEDGSVYVEDKWRVRQEANRKFSVYNGLAYVKGGFRTEEEATTWMNDHNDKMASVGVPVR
jgi:hypothetical protein